jgi:cell wall-associated NlpC family hydrolase
VTSWREQVVAEARRLLGVPFVWHGRTERGLDCYGLVYMCGRAAGFRVPDTRDYDCDVTGRGARREVEGAFTSIPTQEAGPGDVVEYEVRDRPRHYGILTDSGTVIRAQGPAKRGAVRENTFKVDDRYRVVGAYRFREV